MSQALPFQSTCDESCDTPLVVNVPGPAGGAGAAGATGAAGTNAYTVLTDDFAIPAASATATADVTNSNWATVGQVLALETGGTVGAGYYLVTNKPSSTEITLQNLNDGAGAYADNKVAGTVSAGATLSPAGSQGITGATGAGITQLTTKGDLLTHTGAALTRYGIGTNKYTLHVATDTPGWRAVDVSGTNTAITGTLPIANGGTAAVTAAAARASLGTAASGANSDITSLSGLSTPLSQAQGGTGKASIPLFRATSTGNQALATNVTTKVSMDTQVYDTGSDYYNPATYRFTPLVAGYYHLSAQVGVVGVLPGYGFYVQLVKNAAPTDEVTASFNNNGSSAVNAYANVDGIFQANGTTDYFEVWVTSSTTPATTTIVGADAPKRIFFQGHWCG